MMRVVLAGFALLICFLGQPIKGNALEGSLPVMHFCTVASQDAKGLQQLKRSCEKQGIHIEVLGMGAYYRGNSSKFIYVKEYLKQLPPDDLFFFVDAYDVLFVSNEETIRDKFLKMGVPFLISAERYCYPFSHFESRYPRGPSSFRYTNSGSYMGYVHIVQDILNDISPIPYGISDQGMLMKHHFQYPGKQTLDVTCELFMPLAAVQEQEVHIDPESGVVTCVETGTKPCIVHGNGPGRKLYQLIYEYLFAGGRPLRS